MDKTWIHERHSDYHRYKNGVISFLDWAYDDEQRMHRHGASREMIPCPCRKCVNGLLCYREQVMEHVICNGWWETYTTWTAHGEIESIHVSCERDVEIEDVDHIEQMLDDIGNVQEERSDNFFDALRAAEQPIAPNNPMTRLSFLLKLFQIKVMCKGTTKLMTEVLSLIDELLGHPENYPKSWYDAKRQIACLGLTYDKIHACPNDCILYRGDKENSSICPQCGENRYRGNRMKPAKVLRYFPLIPRLQRLFQSEMTAKWMTWHKEGKSDDGYLRHPTDSAEWKNFDERYSEFAAEPRNVRLGIASDGFNPFKRMSQSYSIWPVITVTYNLPPWMCMQSSYMMLTVLVPGPKQPGNALDVYMQPLMDELKELWNKGVSTYDAVEGKSFNMRAALFWTINDFPAYANLSGWSTKGKLACPVCMEDTHSVRLPESKKFAYLGHRRFLPVEHRWRTSRFNDNFDGLPCRYSNNNPRNRLTIETIRWSGDEVLRKLIELPSIRFGQPFKNDVRDLRGFKKYSIFFKELPYWKHLTIRHCLDVMHIEKNVMDNIFDMFNLTEKPKDTTKARDDMVMMGIHHEDHPTENEDGTMQYRPAAYSLRNDQRRQITNFLKNVIVPDGFSSQFKHNISEDGTKISGLKSHDCHVIMEIFIPLAIRGVLPDSICDCISDISEYLKIVCSKKLDVQLLDQWSKQIVITLCKMEQIFPPTFFDVMIHLLIHLADEAKTCGPVQYRWMYPIERYLKRLKDYVFNKAQPEGCIAEGFIAEECINFCAMYMSGSDNRFNRTDRNEDGVSTSVINDYDIFDVPGKPIIRSDYIELSNDDIRKAHFYILQQVDEITLLFEEYQQERLRVEEVEFLSWFKNRVSHMKISNHPIFCEDLQVLAVGPLRNGKQHEGYLINGFRFRTKESDSKRVTQQSGVFVPAAIGSGVDGYYGKIINIVELIYNRDKSVTLFQCEWYDVFHEGSGFVTDSRGTITLNRNRLILEAVEPFVLATQVIQVFYVEDNKSSDWIIPIRSIPRDYFDSNDESKNKEIAAYQQN